MNNTYSIQRIDKATCSEFLKKYHYLSQQGFSFRTGFNYGLYLDDKLIGVAVFHTVSAMETVKGCFHIADQKGIWELGRLAMIPKEDIPDRNMTSWFLSRAIRNLRKETAVRALISYADADYHHGFIYQATNFKYYGLTAKRKDFWEEMPDGTFKKQSRGATVGKKGEWRTRSQKHRYMIVYDNTLAVFWKQESYPKGNNTEYVHTGDAAPDEDPAASAA